MKDWCSPIYFPLSFFSLLYSIIPIILDVYYYYYYYYYFHFYLFVILVYLTTMSGSRLQERGSFECIRGSTSRQLLLVICFILVIIAFCITAISDSRISRSQERGADLCFIGLARVRLSNIFSFIFLLLYTIFRY